jgi:hypothetical protein
MMYDMKHEMHSWDRERKARRFYFGLAVFVAAITAGWFLFTQMR